MRCKVLVERHTAETAAALAAESAAQFVAHYHSTGGYLRDAITTLCDLATADDPLIAAQGLRGIFPFLVERLNDAFRPEYCTLYDRAFAQIVQYCRVLPACRELDAGLRRFGLTTEDDLLARKARQKAHREKLDPADAARVDKVLIPSRVTIGADVAVTSVFLDGMKDAMPHAELVLLALPATRELFAGDPSVRVCEVRYRRDGGLTERLNTWLEVLAATNAEIAGLRPDEYLVADPDSRLTQLGLLPLVADESRHWFFESRSYPGEGSISRLAAGWLANHFHLSREPRPFVAMSEADRAAGQGLITALRRGGADLVVSVHFGVGNNPNKRVPDPFETRLLSALLADGATVVLAKGIGAEEVARAERHIAELQAAGWRVAEADRQNMECLSAEPALGADVLTFEGRLGLFCALVAASDEYIGYDSAGQHIAAALGVSTIDIFADSNTPLAAKRWRPCGPGLVRVVKADELSLNGISGSADQVLGEAMANHTEIRTGQRD
jgi:ADP-heptose:LPS heptosyltransferase